MITIDFLNKPENVKFDFNTWLLKFNLDNDPLINEFIDYILNKNILEIKFSNDLTNQEIGYINIQNIKEKLFEYYDINNEMKQLIENLNSVTDLINNIDLISSKLSFDNDLDYDEVYGYISYLISITKTDIDLTSSHENIFNKITFYPKAIEKQVNKSITIEQIYEITFVKEIHQLYYKYIVLKNTSLPFCDGFKRSDYISSLIKDSLATYYTYKYCFKYNLSKILFIPAIRLHQLIYPAAGFSYILDSNHYQKIFNESIKSMDKALKILFKNNEEQCYEIINRDIYIKYIEKQM